MKQEHKRKSPLKQYRERLQPRPTQEEVARQIPMSLRGYQDIEAGKAIPGIDKALRICAVLKISIVDFCRAIGLDVSDVPSETLTHAEKEA